MNEQLAPQPTHPNQPMGPLEEGDQALVDAVSKIDVGRHVTENGDGNVVVARAEGEPQEDIAAASVTRNDGAVEGASARISDLGISADLIDRSPAQMVAANKSAQGNKVQVGNDPFNLQRGRVQAQSLKLEAARRIESTRDNL